MSVQNNHTEWAVLVLSNVHRVQVTLTPFIIMRAVKNCSLQVNSSSMLIKCLITFLFFHINTKSHNFSITFLCKRNIIFIFYRENMAIYFFMNTSSGCTADLENLEMHFHHDSGMMIFNGFVWDDLSVTPTSFLQHEKFNVFYVSFMMFLSLYIFT